MTLSAAHIHDHAAEGLVDRLQALRLRAAAWLQVRKTEEALSALSDRELEDIGLGRDRIGAAARKDGPGRRARVWSA